MRVDGPSIPWDGRATRGWQSLCWLLPQGTRRLRSRSECCCCTRSAGIFRPRMPSETICARIWLRNRLIRWTAMKYCWRSRASATASGTKRSCTICEPFSATSPPDLIVTMVSPAARFIQRHRQDLFPSTPVIFAALDARAIGDGTLTANDTMVAVSIDQRAYIENILQTLPGTTTVAVVIGDAPIERFWVKELHRGHPAVREPDQFYFPQRTVIRRHADARRGAPAAVRNLLRRLGR